MAANDIPPGGNLHVPQCFSFSPLYFCYCSCWPPFLLRNLYLVHRDLLVFVFYFFPTGSHALDSRQVKYFRLLPCSFCYPSFTFSVSSSQPAPTAELGPSPSEVHSHFMAICPVRACLFLSRATPPKLFSQKVTQCFPTLNLALTNFPLSHRGNTSVSPISSRDSPTRKRNTFTNSFIEFIWYTKHSMFNVCNLMSSDVCVQPQYHRHN